MYYKILFTTTFILLTVSSIAQLNLQIQPNRTTGVAPLYVFFDATPTTGLEEDTELVNADFSWNFDQTNVDPNGDWEVTKGMVAGHVFELPGSYTVQCIVTASNGTIDTAIFPINVQAFSGTTYYVSNKGNDVNDGLSEASPWRTANFAFDQLSASERILFHRGDTFTDVAYNFRNLSGGKMIIGAYGTGNKPILQGAAGEDRMLELDFIDDLVFRDIHIFVDAPNVVSSNFHIEHSSNVLLLDVEMENSAGFAVYNDHCDAVGVFDNYVHHFGVLATYTAEGTRMSWVGNRIDSLIGTPQPEHGIRIQGGEKQFIAHNALTNLINTKTAITIRGDGQRHVMLYRNKMDRLLGVNPQNAQTLAAISFVTIEGNYVGQNTDYTGTSWENSFNGISIEATNVAIRNNVVDGYHNAINVSHDYNGVISGMVEVYHNTVNWRPVSPISFNSGRIVRVRDVSNVNIYNNLITVPNVTQGIVVAQIGTNTNIHEGHNAIRTAAEYTINPLPNSEADVNDIANYQLLPTSIVIDSGATNIPVFYDAHNHPRMMPDLGAFELATCTNEDLMLSGMLTTAKSYETNGAIVSTEMVNGNIEVNYNAQQSITLQAGFSVMVGATFRAQIADCAFSPISTPAVQSRSKERLEIPTFKEKISLTIAPNPVQNIVNAHFYLPKSSTIILKFFNSHGQLLLSKKENKFSGWHQMELSVEHLSKGIYFLSLGTADDQQTKKLIVAH